MSNHESDFAALKREWLVARIFVLGGFALAIGIGVYAGMVWRSNVLHARQQAAAAIAQQQAAEMAAEMAAEKAAEANTNAGAQLCKAMLASAQSFGIVPSFARLSSPDPEKTQVTGRYLCAAETDSSKFTLAADLVCRDLKNPQCVSLYTVAQNGGAVLYQRHN